MIASHLDRHFQIWEFKVSHGSLLIRSPKSPSQESNIDLIFVGVDYIAVPRHMDGLELRIASPSEWSPIVHSLQVKSDSRVFSLVSHGYRHVVVAAACEVVTHQADIFDSPFA